MGLTHYIYKYVLLQDGIIVTINVNDILLCHHTGLLMSNVMPL